MSRNFQRVADPAPLEFYCSRGDLFVEGSPVWYEIIGVAFVLGGVIVFQAVRQYDLRVAFNFIAGVFVLIGLISLESGLYLRIPERRHRRLIAQCGDLPWTRDYGWDPTGQTISNLHSTLRFVAAGLFYFVAFNSFAVLAYTDFGPGGWPLQYIVAPISSCISLLFLYFLAIKQLLHYLKFGSSRLLYDHAPFITGTTLKAQLRPSSAVACSRFEKFTLTFRCIQPRYHLERRGEEQIPHVDFRQFHVQEFSATQFRFEDRTIYLEFAIPADAPGTSISSPMAKVNEDDTLNESLRYWEVQAYGELPGLDYKASFLVPIYRSEQLG